MLIRMMIFALLLSPSTFACFNNSGCPAGNSCVKTGNIIGTCVSSASYLFTNPVIANPPGRNLNSRIQSSFPPNQIYLPQSVYARPETLSEDKGSIRSCTNNGECGLGFTCTRAGGQFYGVCVRSAS